MTFNLYSKQDIKNYFAKEKYPIKKEWGQCFLIDPNIIRNIAQNIKKASDRLKIEKNVIEIGAGFGALTNELINLGFIIYAIEIDRILYSFLYEQKKEGLYLLRDDVLEFFKFKDKKKYKFLSGATNKKAELYVCEKEILQNNQELKYLCGNLPYSITTKILIQAMNFESILGAIFLVQKEYAERIISQKKSNSISIYLHNFGNWEIKQHISKSCFYPKPKVDSSLIEFKSFFKNEKSKPHILEKILRLSFMHPRKQLQNNWKKNLSFQFSNISQSTFFNIAKNIGIDSSLRAEDIPKEKYYELASQVSQL